MALRVGLEGNQLRRPANRIRELREDRGFNRVRFAEILGVSLKHVFTIECGKVNPSVPLLMKIRDALDCALDDIYPRSKAAVAA